MSNMLDEVYYLPELIEEQIPILDNRVRDVLDYRSIFSIKEIVFTGCGDSYFAGLGARHFFQRVCNINSRALQSMEASRYDLVDYRSAFPYNPLVLATSVSGMVIRTVEAVETAKAQGALTIGLVGNLESPLAKAVDKIIYCDLKPLPRSPGVASFRISLLAMYLFGIHLAEVRRSITVTEGNRLRDQLKNTAQQIYEIIKNCEGKTKQLAEMLKETKYYVFLGDGPNYASAIFSAAKITEGVGHIAVSQNTEEWAHLQYFENAFPNIPTFILVSKNRGYNRVLELMAPMKRIGRYVIAISPNACQELNSLADVHLPVSDAVFDLFSPMVYPVSCELFASYLSDTVGAGYYRENLKIYPKYANTIRENALLTIDELKKYG